MFKYIFSRYKDSFFYLASNIIMLPISLVTSPLFAQNLSSSDFAAIGFFSNFQLFVLPIMTLSFYSYYMTGYHQRSEDENNYVLRVLFSFLILINLFISLTAYFVLNYYLEFSHSTFSAHPLGLIVLFTGFFSISLGFWNLRLRFQRKSSQYFLINLFSSITSVALGLLLVIYFQFGSAGRLLPPLIVNGFFFVVFFLKYIKNVVIDMKIIKKAMLFCYPLLLTAILSLPVTYIDKFFLERLNNLNEFALYNIAENISGYYGVFAAAILQTFEPDVFKVTGEKNKKSLIKIFLIFFTTLLIGFSILSAMSESVVSYLTAGKYTGATTYMIPMLFFKMLEPVLYFFGFILISLNLTKIMLLNKILLALISIPIYVYLIDAYSFSGAIYAKIIISLIALVLMFSQLYFRNNCLFHKFKITN